VRGLDVEQSPSDLGLHEGTKSALRCNFSTTIMSVQWFRQNPRGSLIRLFYLTPGTKENRRLNSTFDSKERYSTLHIRDAQLEDSGTYLCAAEAQCFLQACSLVTNCSWVCRCSPDMGRLDRVCQGEQGEHHTSMILLYIENPGWSQHCHQLHIYKKAKHFSLCIANTQPGDSAMYFCA
ncbi:hypothetical protein U0070_012430, partial [Myodes glareolus]